MISLLFHNFVIRSIIFIILFMLLISGCAQLDGIFPKLKPQSDEDISPVAHSPATVAAKQEELSAENNQLVAKIEKLEQQINSLEKKQNKQSEDFQLLQQQWEKNFSLLEISVENFLSSSINSKTPSTINDAWEEQNQTIDKTSAEMNVTSKVSLPAFENYSLLKKRAPVSKKSSPDEDEAPKINDLDAGKEEIIVEEPGFPDVEEVNHDDLEDIEDLPDPESPVMTTNFSFGISNDMFFKLCSFEPFITIFFCII